MTKKYYIVAYQFLVCNARARTSGAQGKDSFLLTTSSLMGGQLDGANRGTHSVLLWNVCNVCGKGAKEFYGREEAKGSWGVLRRREEAWGSVVPTSSVYSLSLDHLLSVAPSRNEGSFSFFLPLVMWYVSLHSQAAPLWGGGVFSSGTRFWQEWCCRRSCQWGARE